MKSRIKAENKTAEGLCVNCGSQDECGLSRPDNGPVEFCEEHWTMGLKTDINETNKSMTEGKPPIPNQAAGLCLNCLNRLDCRLPKNEGGVWYCEEYE